MKLKVGGLFFGGGGLEMGCWDGWEWASDCAAVAAERGGK